MARTYDWTAPAKLFFWPAENGADEEVVYPTLLSALRAAAEGESASAWIITQEGDILNPKMIEEIRLDVKPARRVGLFGRSWAARASL